MRERKTMVPIHGNYSLRQGRLRTGFEQRGTQSRGSVRRGDVGKWLWGEERGEENCSTQ